MPSAPRTRRRFLKETLAAGAGSMVAPELLAQESAGPFQATGTKCGEVTPTSALLWTRLTAAPARNATGTVFQKHERGTPPDVVSDPDTVEGACPGTAGRVRLRYGLREDLADATTTAWAEAAAENDFTHQFALSGLSPATTYHYVSEAAPGGEARSFRGQFTTAPAEQTPSDLRFCVTTCQGYPDRDHADGHPVYPAMLALAPQFICFTGDNVYYDNDAPRAMNRPVALLHWQRMFSLPRQVELLRRVPGYFQKDDHDTLSDDCEPGMASGELSFAEGQRIFRQQMPVGEGPQYRTFRWGRDLQIWLSEGRDSRSPKRMADGPGKTIWGAEQKAWFKRTVAESKATWKILVSPTPLVGPDRIGKNDNHSNAGFQHEGDELRAWLQANVPQRFFVVCGDRHWQYHSVHPVTKVREFSCGPASNSHASGSPGENPEYHQFHRVKGGFLAVTLRPEGTESVIRCEHRDVDGKVVHTWEESSHSRSA